MTKVVDDFCETEDTGEMKDGGCDPSDVDASDGVAFVHEGLVA